MARIEISWMVKNDENCLEVQEVRMPMVWDIPGRVPALRKPLLPLLVVHLLCSVVKLLQRHYDVFQGIHVEGHQLVTVVHWHVHLQSDGMVRIVVGSLDDGKVDKVD